MIVIDRSAIVAIFEAEDEGERFAHAISSANQMALSALNAHETAIVSRCRRGAETVADFWSFLQANEIEIVAFDEDRARAASAAFGRSGKGIHSKAKPNLADCAAYALAKSLSTPLLFKGDDFTHTHVKPWR